MTANEYQPASPPDAARSEEPQWEQRLQKALWVNLGVLCVVMGLAMGAFNIHLSEASQRIVLLVTFAAFVFFSILAPIVIIQQMRRKPAPNRSGAWGFRSLAAGLFLALPCAVWLFFPIFLQPRSISISEGVVILGALLLAVLLMCVGLVLVVVGISIDWSRQALALWRGTRSNLRE